MAEDAESSCCDIRDSSVTLGTAATTGGMKAVGKEGKAYVLAVWSEPQDRPSGAQRRVRVASGSAMRHRRGLRHANGAAGELPGSGGLSITF